MPNKTITIITGGQTGIDRAAWDAALKAKFPIGGWVPEGRLAEDGKIPPRYKGLKETDSEENAERTRLNVEDCSAVMIIGCNCISPGTALARRTSGDEEKPCISLNLDDVDEGDTVDTAIGWLEHIKPVILNVAGPRASEWPKAYERGYSFLLKVFTGLNQ